MKYSSCLGVVYLLIAISSVHSASYLYRFGREVVVPTANDEVKEIVSELKKDEPVVIVEELAAVPNVPFGSENVEQTVAAKNVPASAENVPAVENNLIAAADDVSIADAAVVQPAVVPSRVINEEARAKPNPAIRFDELEVIQPGGGKSEKVQTVADTVKSAAVQAIEKQNEEVEKSKPVETVKEPAAPIVKTVPEDVVLPVKSIDVVSAPEQLVVPAVKDESVVAPVGVVPKVEVEKLVESVRSAEIQEPAKKVQEQKVEIQDQKVQVVKSEPDMEKAEPAPPTPERQDSAATNPNQPSNPLNQIQTTLTQITANFQNALNGIIANCKLNRKIS